MSIDAISRICVVGAGTMGSQIALQCALHGYTVALTDAKEDVLQRGMESNRAQLRTRVTKGRITQEDADRALERVSPVATLEQAAGNADYVIEAVYEDIGVKRGVFAQLDAICPPHTILASNSSTMVISKIVENNVARADRAVNMHFFHPVLVMKLVEVGKGPQTSDATTETAMELSRRIGKEPVLILKENYGFIVNFALFGLSRAAWFLLEGGYASHEDIDKALKLGLNHPMGPFELSDFSGLDISYNVMLERYRQSGDPADKPPARLEQMVREGHLGRKTGKGFYEYGE